MTKHINHRVTSLLWVCTTLAAGCGGGGGGDDGSTGGPPPAPRFPPGDAVITTDNALAIAGGAMAAALYGGHPYVLEGPELTGGSPGGEFGKPARRDGPAIVFAAPFGPETVGCDRSGTVTLAGETASEDTLTPGDAVHVRASACDDGLGWVLDGTMLLTVDAFEGDPFGGPVLLGLTLSFQRTRLTDGAGVTTLDGGVSMLLDTRDYPLTTLGLAGGSLLVADRDDALLLSNFSLEAVLDESAFPPAYTRTASGRLGVAGIGWVDYRVEAPFGGFGVDDPTAGVLAVRGAGGATIVATALADGSVGLEMDYDGNGVADEVQTVRWAALRQ